MKSFAIILITLLLITPGINAQESADTIKNQSAFRQHFIDTLDSAFDVSSFLYKPEGFIPIPLVITEPAVGIGGGAALVFFNPNEEMEHAPPNLTGVAGLGTANGTWGAGLFHLHIFKDDKIRVMGAAAKANINIDYYGNQSDYLSQHPVGLNMDAWIFFARSMFRVASSNFFLGADYTLFTTDNSIDTLADRPIINDLLQRLGGRSTLSMLTLKANYDSRDNIFTPGSGIDAEIDYAINATWLGADNNNEKLITSFLGYFPVGNRVNAGFRYDGAFSFGDTPPYALPFIILRGVPVMKYMGNNTMLAETEWRARVFRRYSLLAFTGTGKAFTSVSEFQDAKWVYNYGVGARYLLARLFGLQAGFDVAWSNDDFAFYLTIGSAWLR